MKKPKSLSEEIHVNLWNPLEEDLESVVHEFDLVFNEKTKRRFVSDIFWGMHSSLKRGILDLALEQIEHENPEHRRKRVPKD